MAITLQKNTQKIEESEKRYRNLVENAADAIFVLSLERQKVGTSCRRTGPPRRCMGTRWKNS